MARARLALAGLTAVVSAAAVVVAAGAQRPAAGLRLPDLVQEPPSDIGVRRAAGRVHLGFASAVTNVGDGPLRIVGTRTRAGMSAAQLIDGARHAQRRPRVGVLRYTRSPDHQHWHLLRFDRYVLRRPGGGTIAGDRKTGFCLGDRFADDDGRTLSAAPAQPRFVTNCGPRRPGLRRITVGISVGYGDNYKAQLEGQYLDVTGLAPGRYELVHEVNADRALLESRYDNNVACVPLTLTYPRGRAALPALDESPARGRCAPITSR